VGFDKLFIMNVVTPVSVSGNNYCVSVSEDAVRVVLSLLQVMINMGDDDIRWCL
jgi:hypothetical protein